LACEFLQKKENSYKIIRSHLFEYLKIEISLYCFPRTPSSNLTARMNYLKIICDGWDDLFNRLFILIMISKIASMKRYMSNSEPTTIQGVTFIHT